jgi:hypothetical protein
MPLQYNCGVRADLATDAGRCLEVLPNTQNVVTLVDQVEDKSGRLEV